eukprot:GEMP01132785.1.p1 GENE.GEMP01132785.1~~GEMP01132785.1.p1  ORF type:complete len:117 (-),score=5.79 GEMP01132785.1:114-464(-)
MCAIYGESMHGRRILKNVRLGVFPFMNRQSNPFLGMREVKAIENTRFADQLFSLFFRTLGLRSFQLDPKTPLMRSISINLKIARCLLAKRDSLNPEIAARLRPLLPTGHSPHTTSH